MRWRFRLRDPMLAEPVELYFSTPRTGHPLAEVRWDHGETDGFDEALYAGWPLADPGLAAEVLERVDQELARACLAAELSYLLHGQTRPPRHAGRRR